MFMLEFIYCDSMWYFWGGSESLQVFYRLLISVFWLDCKSHYQNGEGWDSRHRFNPAKY